MWREMANAFENRLKAKKSVPLIEIKDLELLRRCFG
jgi:hypothetical protein